MRLNTEARRLASRRNGARGGRPRLDGHERMLRDEALAACRRELAACVQFWTDVLEGRVPEATIEQRMRAYENLADRGGLARRDHHEIVGEQLPVKLIDLRDWPDEEPPSRTENGDEPN